MNKTTKDTQKVGEAYEKLYGPLPESKVLAKSQVKSDENNETMKEFIRGHLPASDQKEIDGEMKKSMPLRNVKDAKKIKGVPPKRQRKTLNAREKREMHLFKLPKKGMKFADYRPLHDLWKGYMGELIDWSRFKSDPDTRPGGDEGMQTQLCRADFHGAYFKVTRASNPGLMGVEGYVLMETKNTLQILGKDNVLKTVPKSGSTFSYQYGGHLIQISGSTMCMKPAERNVKKWKLRLPYKF